MAYKKVEKVMTYDQWEEEIKNRRKKRIRDTVKQINKKLERLFYVIIISCMFWLLPIFVIAHYIVVGY
ncbi:hypothetical protein F170042I7_21230 [Blautia caecimuris]|uniref:hypothetical protein n=1 Tax=Blautia caecimuris TaxID=1796615 RepID=UPI0034BAEEA2